MEIQYALILEIAFLLPIMCIQTFLYMKTIGPSQKWSGSRLAFAILLVTVVESVLQLIALRAAAWVQFLGYMTIILYPVVFMGGKIKERFFYGIANCAILLFSSLLSIAIVYTQSTDMPDTLEQALLLSACLIAIHAILVLIITHLNTEGKRYIPHKYWTGIIICFSVILIGFYVAIYVIMGLKDADQIRMFLAISSVVFVVIWLLSYFIFFFLCRYFTKVAEANALAIQNDMIERYILRKQASDERIRVLSHDLKHSLTQWRTLAEEKSDTNALQSIAEYEGQLRDSLLINVENESANAIINQKHWEANQAKVDFVADGAFHKDLLISKLDLCSLLGNLLDNAIEAAAQAETETLRCVKLSIRRKGNLLILVVENGYALAPAKENGVFVTRKKDKDLHAIGMRSIQYVAENYDGVVNNAYENNWFKATVMLRGYQTALSDDNCTFEQKQTLEAKSLI